MYRAQLIGSEPTRGDGHIFTTHKIYVRAMKRTPAELRLWVEQRSSLQKLVPLSLPITNDDYPIVRVLDDDDAWRRCCTRCKQVVVGQRVDTGTTVPSEAQLNASWGQVQEIGRVIDVKPPTAYLPVGDYIRRLMYVAQHVNALFIVGRLRDARVEGTAKWPCEMAVWAGARVFLFDMAQNRWLTRDGTFWRPIPQPPTLRQFFAVACIGATADKTTPEARTAIEALTVDLR